MTVRIHPTAIVEQNVTIGDGSSVWDSAHIRHDAVIGDQCIIGGKATIAYGVVIGNRCKINSMAYLCHGVTLEDGVMISAGVIFTNDRFPRAASADLTELASSDPNEHTLHTMVRCGATIGAGSIIGSNLEIGRWAMVGMGAIVTKSVPDFHLVYGTPARSVAAVCRCGEPIANFSELPDDQSVQKRCTLCNRRYQIAAQCVTEIEE